MKRFFKKRIACILCVAMIFGCIPANGSKAEETTESKDEASLLIEGSVVGSGTNAKIQLEVKTNAFKDYSATVQDGIRYCWYIGNDEENMAKASTTQATYELQSSDLTAGNAYIQVEAVYEGPTDGMNGEYPQGKSRLLQIKDSSLQVDSVAGVTVQGSVAGGSNGAIKIEESNNDLQYYMLETPENVLDFQQGKLDGLSADQKIGVIYKKGIVAQTTILNSLYAVYTIPVDSAQTPDVSASPSANVTTEPTPTTVSQVTNSPAETPAVATGPITVPDISAKPNNTVKPSQIPAIVTTPPTKSPADTAKPDTEPTEKPDGTTEPIETPAAEPGREPGVSAEPTKVPTVPGNPVKVDMSKSGTEVAVGNVVYRSNGSNSVSYDGVKEDKKTVSVPDKVTIEGKSYPVTKISSGAFSGSKVEKVTLGKNVKNIGAGAFKNCKKLTKVSFPSNVTTVGTGSFSGCTKLKSVTLPASVKTVGSKAFKNCKKLKTFKLGKSVKVKKGKVMFGATGGKKVAIGASALENCLSLRSVIINSQVTKIGNNTFKNCKKLASMLVKSLKLKTVGNRALKGVSNCKISVPTIRLKKYRTLFTNKGQGKKVVIAKV